MKGCQCYQDGKERFYQRKKRRTLRYSAPAILITSSVMSGYLAFESLVARGLKVFVCRLCLDEKKDDSNKNAKEIHIRKAKVAKNLHYSFLREGRKQREAAYVY